MLIYLGSGSSYGAKSEFVQYTEGGLILSQGLWRIDCEWRNNKDLIAKGTTIAKDTTIAKGTTGEIWINLNTTSVLVFLENNIGIGSFSLDLYKVKSTDSSVSSVSFDVSLCKYDNGSLGNNIISASDIILGTETDYISTLKIPKNILDAGFYLLTIKVYNGNSLESSNLLFTDVLGFIVRGGHETNLSGECDVTKGTSGRNEYIYWEDNPKKPSKQDGVISVGGDTTDSEGNIITTGTDLSKTVITHESVIIVNRGNCKTRIPLQKMNLYAMR